MAGLLEWYGLPQTQGLLGLSAGLLAAGGPNTQKLNVGQGLSRGLLLGSELSNDAHRGQLMGLQGQAMRTSLEAQKRAQAAIDAFAQQVPEQDRTRFLADPAAYIKTISEPYTLSPGQERRVGSQVIAQAAPNLHFQNTGSGVVGLNQQTGQQVGPAIPVTMTPGEDARLNWDKYQFGNLSRYQGAQLGNEAQRIGLEGQRVGLERANTVFNIVPGANGLTGRAAQEVAASAAKIPAQAQAQAAIDLPQAQAKAEQAISLIDQMIGTKDKPAHPGLPGAVGAPALEFGTGVLGGPIATRIPGTKEASFQALLDQVKGGAFLQAFESLKGGGAITEVEGKKATDAITRMSTSQSEAEFIKAAKEYQDVIKKGAERAKQRASAGPVGAASVESLLEKYK